MENASFENDEFVMEPVVVPIDGVLDLHTFAPKDLDGLLQEYIDACIDNAIYELRIIHGKGSGVMKSRVRSFLKKSSKVVHFKDAPANAGGWGATLATLTKDSI